MPVVEPALTLITAPNLTCSSFTTALSNINACQPVEAFIDVGGSGAPYPPIFYRCYWRMPVGAVRQTLQHEWSVTGEFIEWYVNNYYPGGNPQTGSVTDILGGAPPSGASVFLVPLLKVTNHSPEF